MLKAVADKSMDLVLEKLSRDVSADLCRLGFGVIKLSPDQ
jgi:hypothetical protein